MIRAHFPHMVNFLTIIALIAGFLATDPVQAASTIYRVKSDGLNAGACGSSWENACALQHALSLSVSGDQIWVAAGIYKPTNGTDRTISFALKNGVAAYGGFNGHEADISQRDPIINISILSGDIGTTGDNSDNSYHVVYSNQVSEATILDGFTIKHGNANGTYPYSRGGGFFNYNSSVKLTGLIITENSAVDLGGGIYNYGGNPYLLNLQFIKNESQNRGGGVYNYSSVPSLENTTFLENHAKELGGGMNSFDSDQTLSNLTFTNNSAGTSGGGMFSFGGSFELTNATFEGNTAKGGGGLYNTWYSNGILNNVQFNNNSALERGGGMYNYLSTSTLNGVTFTQNAAKQYGGGMFIGDSNPVLNQVTFTNNSTDDKGGGVTNNASNPSFTSVTFSGNTAKYGGGIYNFDYSSPILTNVSFTDNHASFRGGGMFGVTSSNFALVDVTFTGNTAQEYGGGIFTDSSAPTLTRVRFINNTGQKRGGGIYSSGSDPTLQDVSFSGNSSVDGGGMNNSASDARLTNVTFDNNIASNRGGGLYNYLGSTKLNNITFYGNSAQTYGGGIFNSTGSLNIKNATFSENDAGEYGGGIAMDETSSQVVNTILWQNNAGMDGDQVHGFDAGDPAISFSVVENGCPDAAVCTNILTGDPLLGNPGDHGGFPLTIPILEGSSAVDSGDNSKCGTLDQRGVVRPQGQQCDIGAYESEFENNLIPVHSPADDEKLTTSKVTFKWSEVAGATAYRIRLSTKADFSTLVFTGNTADASYAYDSVLKFGQTYYWQIRPFYGDEKGAWSPVFRFYSMDALKAPDLLSPQHKEKLINTDVGFSWSAVENGAQYKIVVATDPYFSKKVFATKVDEASASYTLPLGKYYWRVRAFDAADGKGPWSKVQIFKIIP